MLTPAQRDEFDRTGLLHLPGAIPAAAVATMRGRIWQFLDCDPNDPATWLQGPLPLVTFPDHGKPWQTPTTGWHLDSQGPEHALPGVTVFAYLTDVAARGGGTTVLAGSHHLVNNTTGSWKPAAIKTTLAATSPWLAAVWRGERSPDDEATVDGTELALKELTATPADVILMHPRTFHAPAPNPARTPRMMLVEIIRA